MNLRLIASTIVLTAAVAACGGGGGSPPPPPTTSTPTPTPTQASSTTNASGTVVDDGTGSPLAGVSVKLMPWAPCGATPVPATSITPENDGCPTPLPSPQATTAANGTFTLNGVPNGHYLLVIGADVVATVPPGYTTPPGNCSPNPCPAPTAVGFTVQATVHDNVTLSGGNQTLTAPTMPPVPAGYIPSSWETNGTYRLATMNATNEMPCYIAWQYQRSQHSLAGTTADEWLLENVRAVNAYAPTVPTGTSLPVITTGGDSTTGGVSCYPQIASSFVAGANSYATDPRTLWFAGQYVFSTAYGTASFTIDPRSFIDPNHPTWP